MDYPALIQALGLLSGTHTLNHLSVANQTGAPAGMSSLTTEEWDRPQSEVESEKTTRTLVSENKNAHTKTWNDHTEKTYFPEAAETDRNAAGFVGQDKMNEALNTPEGNAANALYKAIYLIGGGAGKGTYKDGDFGGIAENSGLSRDQVKGMVGVTAIYDALKALSGEDSKWKNVDINFDVLNGSAPGLVFNMKW